MTPPPCCLFLFSFALAPNTSQKSTLIIRISQKRRGEKKINQALSHLSSGVVFFVLMSNKTKQKNSQKT
jgi:hypothetical protein